MIANGLYNKLGKSVGYGKYAIQEVAIPLPESLLPSTVSAYYDKFGQVLVWDMTTRERPEYDPTLLLEHMISKGAVIGGENTSVICTSVANGSHTQEHSEFNGVRVKCPTNEYDVLGGDSLVSGWDWFIHVIELLPMRDISHEEIMVAYPIE